jgi:hypothetical protein
MTNQIAGRVIEVIGPPPKGGKPKIVLYFAAIDDDAKAVEAVRLFVKADPGVTARPLGGLSLSTIGALGMRQGQVMIA